MLLGTVLLWALNITVTQYMFLHGWKPLAYGTIRYFAAIALFWGFTYRRERSFRIARADLPLVCSRRSSIFANQVCFVYGVKLANASTVALVLGTTPVFIGLIRSSLRLRAAAALVLDRRRDHVRRRRARRPLGAGSRRSASLAGDLIAVCDRVHLGVLHGLDRAADAPLLALPDQRARARGRLGAAGAGQHPGRSRSSSSRSAGRSGSASATRSSARSS